MYHSLRFSSRINSIHIKYIYTLPTHTHTHTTHKHTTNNTQGFLYYLQFHSKNDAHSYWQGMDRGEIDKPMFEIGMKGVEGGEEESK